MSVRMSYDMCSRPPTDPYLLDGHSALWASGSEHTFRGIEREKVPTPTHPVAHSWKLNANVHIKGIVVVGHTYLWKKFQLYN